MPASTTKSTAFTLTRAPDRGSHLRLAGHLSLDEGAALWRQFEAALREIGAGDVNVDVAGVESLDGGAAALLAAGVAQHRVRGGDVSFVGAGRETARLLALYDCARGGPCERPWPRQPGLLTDIGSFTYVAVDTTRAILAFIGDLVVGVVQAARSPRTVHFADLGSLIERAGADGIPIVLLINFLIGAILGLQGAIQLHRFGGDPFLANLVGLSVVRELGPLMTAILVTGRSGAAYAAELGTMTVNEEIDALRTLGQDPQRFLVFPRVVALVFVVPILTVLGDLVGSLGGLAIAVTYLEQPSTVYLQALQRAVHLGDVATGLLKSVAFAVAIALIACQRGLATRGGAAGVGRSTTSAVVVVLFMLVALDAVFTWVFSLLGW
ncbi:MAG TPA: MlaE family lipid ABC transporter permease subunit [Planctomycetota bacterium]|nr:MlaE family lipid ABC transporter permease subunit [Planctomycetota bacterium]